MVKFVAVWILVGLLASKLVFAAELQDPTQPVLASGMQPSSNSATPTTLVEPELLLQSILVSVDRRLAMVNGRMVKVGDKIEGYTVVRIEPQQLELRDASKKIKKLQLYQTVGKN